jgi:hypothetical protein
VDGIRGVALEGVIAVAVEDVIAVEAEDATAVEAGEPDATAVGEPALIPVAEPASAEAGEPGGTGVEGLASTPAEDWAWAGVEAEPGEPPAAAGDVVAGSVVAEAEDGPEAAAEAGAVVAQVCSPVGRGGLEADQACFPAVRVA